MKANLVRHFLGLTLLTVQLVSHGAIRANCLETQAGSKVCRETSQVDKPRARKVAPSGSLLPYEVFRGQLTYLVSYVEYFPQTCALVSQGSWTVDRSPVYGDVYTETIEAPLANGDCPGIVFPRAAIYYTWTNQSPAQSSDSFTATWTSPDFLQADDFTLTRIPVITGLDNIWWFDNATPANYAVKATLAVNTNTPSSYTWNISSAAGSAVFADGSSVTTTSVNQVEVKSTAPGPLPPNSKVQLTVTVDGFTSDPFFLTVRAPDRLVPQYTLDRGIPKSIGIGWISKIHYKLIDQYGETLPWYVEMNEHFTTPVCLDRPNTNGWQQPEPNQTRRPFADPDDFVDELAVAQLKPGPVVPVPRSPKPPLDRKPVMHWEGVWRAGSSEEGMGRPVLSPSWVYYEDHGKHQLPALPSKCPLRH